MPLPFADIITLHFDPSQYDLLAEAEPTAASIPMVKINPLIIRNRNEILTRKDALNYLGINPADKHCLFALSGKSKEYRDNIKTYSYLEDEGYRMVYFPNFKNFPAVDYYNTFDLIISGGGYNAF